MNIRVFLQRYSEDDEYDAINKGFRYDVLLYIVEKEMLYNLYVINYIRLQQDINHGLQSEEGYVYEENTIVVVDMDYSNIVSAISKTCNRGCEIDDEFVPFMVDVDVKSLNKYVFDNRLKEITSL